jgi:putative membrane protein
LDVSKELVKREKARSRSLAKGVLAGLVGGIVATAAKSLAERMYPPHAAEEKEPPTLTVVRKNGHEYTLDRPETLQWGLGAATGAAYGAVAEYFPTATAKDGGSFGMALVTLSHKGALLGLAKKPEEQTQREQSSEIASLLVFGVVTETVRRIVRRALA